MKRVLYIAYYFPPDGGAGTQRSLKFCKYLPEFGWQPTVVTREANRERGEWDPEDQSFMKELPADVSIVRVSPEVTNRFPGTSLSDITASYLRGFYTNAARLLKDQDFQAIIITMSPFGLAEVGARLNSDFGIPVIYDLRDPWALDGWRAYRSKLHWFADLRRMRSALSSAAGVVANTAESEKAFKLLLARNSTMPAMTVIPNGYDGEDFVTGGHSTNRPKSQTEFVVVHAGTLHTSNLYESTSWLAKLKRLLRFRPEPISSIGRTEYFLYQAIRMLREDGHPLGDLFRFVCVGQNSEANIRCAREADLLDQVEFTGYLSHEESIARLICADALFLPLHGLPDGDRSLIVPGKTYEYLAANRPIIAALPLGDARELVERSGRGFVAMPCNPMEIANCLRVIYDQRSTLRESSEIPAWIKFYERRSLTMRLATFLDEVADLSAQSTDSNTCIDSGSNQRSSSSENGTER